MDCWPGHGGDDLIKMRGEAARRWMSWQRFVNGTLLAVSIVIATGAGWSAMRAAHNGRAAVFLASALAMLSTLVLAYACADALRRGGAPRERSMIAVITLISVGLCVQVFWL